MPLPSTSASQLKKTEVVRVDCYYLGGEGGSLELHSLHACDFAEAATAHPADWVLAEAVETMPQFRPYKMPPGPPPKIVDKRNVPKFPGPQIAPAMAMVDQIPLHERRLPGGSLLFPRGG